MCNNSPAPPPAPDYAGAAVAQGAANVDAARVSAKLSNPNIVGPFGNQTVTYDGDVPTVTQTLTPTAQSVLDSQQQTQLGLANLAQQGIGTAQNLLGTQYSPSTGALTTSLDTSNLAQMPVNAGTTGQEAIMARMRPELDRRREQLDTQLRNQGLVSGGEAYDYEMNQFAQQENDALQQAALTGINLDTAARSQGFNELMQGAQFGNTAEQQQMQRELSTRQLPLNEITALMSGSQVQLPQFQQYQGQNVAPAPVFAGAQAAGNNALQQYGIQQSGANANMAGLYGLGGAALNAGGMYMGLRR